MLRFLLVVLLTGLGVVRGSDKIDAPSEGASAPVTQPHVVAELIPEMTTVEAGKPFGMILHLHMDPGWHTYWINPGDAGLATTIKWTLPPGFTAGPIDWPTPEKHAMGPLMTYGYDGDVYLLTTITPPATGDLPEHFPVKAKAEWLVCQEECIPGKAELTVTEDSGVMNFRLPVVNTELFKEARERLPVEQKRWIPSAKYVGDRLIISFMDISGSEPEVIKPVYFFPEQQNVLSAVQGDDGVDVRSPIFKLNLALQQNGEKPDKLSGVLVSDQPLLNAPDRKAVYTGTFTVTPDSGAGPAPATSGSAAPSSGANASEPAGQRPAATDAGGPSSGADANAPAAGTAAANSANATSSAVAGANGDTTGGHRPPLQADTNASEPAAQRAAATGQPLLIAVLGAAFVGGLILNLMPCVLPVLSLKVFALIRHAGEHPEKAWRQGVAFAAGVVVSFWILAGLLLALRAAGNQLGWGFQMQSPGFVAGLIVLFFLIGLNLFGVFEIGGSLVGVDAKAASRAGGGVSSFLNGALATVAATPCTAPFMGSALGFAAQQPAFVSLLIFTFLALGMATPYLLLTCFPQTLRFVPKPGAWMESLKQFMGFLLMGTVIFLIYVFSRLTDLEGDSLLLLFPLLMIALAAWIYGKWGAAPNSAGTRLFAVFLVVALAGLVIYFVVPLFSSSENRFAQARYDAYQKADGWQDWSPDAVQVALQKGQPVFVDFTAAWCLSCKVNERVALGTDAVKKVFADKDVALFRADWTHADPLISQTLRKFNRDGVPLYLLYSPKAPDAPQVLPEVLTPGIVLDALGKI